MRLAISGTYSAGKTLTSYALAHYVDMPRIRARTMRELLPLAVPGKTLEECDAAELVHLIVRRHVERASNEAQQPASFVSDGSSLQEWLYGTVRLQVGINPNASVHLADDEAVEQTPELQFFASVMHQLGLAFKDHVRDTYDVFVHLPNELALSPDGHRPVNERFRRMADEGIASVIDELGIPRHVIGGTVEQRLLGIADTLNLRPVCSTAHAIERATEEYRALDMRVEADRAWAAEEPAR